jgi:hypothetical protein
VKKWCLEYCAQQLYDLPVNVEDYNIHWIRTEYIEESDQKDAKARLHSFIQENWHQKIASGEIPWKLMDGTGALGFVRKQIQEKNIMLPDQLLMDNLSVVPVPDEFKKLISIIKSWPCEK